MKAKINALSLSSRFSKFRDDDDDEDDGGNVARGESTEGENKTVATTAAFYMYRYI